MALMLSVLSSGLLQAAPAYAKPGDDIAADKQVYCNIEGDSGKWKAQISNGNTEHEYPLTGVFVHDQKDVTSEMDAACATQYGTITTPEVAQEVVCGPDNDIFSVTDGDNYDVVDNEDGTFTLTADAGFLFSTSGTNSETLTAPEDANTVCDTEDEIITTPEVIQEVVCGPDNDIYSVIDGDNYTVTDNEDGTFTLTADAGFLFSTSGTNTETLIAPEDENTVCEQEPTDLCSNIDGVQSVLPDYVTVRGNDRCVVTICHRTNSVTNPYVVETPDANAVDGDTGNNTGQGDHYAEHQGPVFDPNAVYPTPHNGDQWGDIIPAVPGLTPGLNWDANGQATYNNECTPTEAGTPNIAATIICVPNGVKVTLTNTGNADGSATVNGSTHAVPASSSVEVTLPFDLGTPFQTVVTVTVNGTTSTQTLNCAPGQGGGQTLGSSTTNTPQVQGASTELPAALPSTGGEQNPMLILLASLMAYGIAYLFQGRRQLNQTRA
jgi:hypothetical protein